MKIVIIGGSGLIGTKLARILRDRGHDVLAASRSTGVDLLTGDGLAAAFAGASVVVDVSNSPSFEPGPVMAFFQTSGRHLAAAEKATGVKHHVALSVVGAERQGGSGYMAAKLAQEALIRASGVPYTIVRATQFFEFVEMIAGAATTGDLVRVSEVMMQPIAADDVAAALADAATAAPLNAIADLAGPEPIRMDALVHRFLAGRGDARRVTVDNSTGYFGATVDDRSLVPTGPARLGATRFDAWLAAHTPATV